MRWQPLSFALFALTVAAWPLFGQQPGKKYALLVGVNRYDHASLSNLRFAENDVTVLGKLLQDSKYTVVLLTGQQGDAQQPTLVNIHKQLDALLKRCKRDDTLLVALAGHGVHFDKFNDSFFCPQDAHPFEEETATLLSLKQVYEKLGRCGAGAKLLMVDACRNNPKLNRGRNFDATSLVPPSGVGALFSCKKGEVAFEHEKYQHGVFFHHVLQGLRGDARDDHQEVTWDSLQAYVKRRVPADVKRLISQDAQQTPTQSAVEFEGAVLLQAGVGQPSTVAELKKEITNSIGMKLVLIPAGKFTMGSPKDEADRNKDNETSHEVEITQPFYTGVYEVTQQEYQEVMGKNPSWFSAGGDGKEKVQGQDTRRFPVEKVSWDDAMEFCRLLSERAKEKAEQRVYTLPTEAQWEYACRGPARSYQVFHFGNSLSSRQANFNGKYPYGGAVEGPYHERTTTVGSYEKNGFGLFDMHGNVWEWCADWYAPDNTVFGRKDPTGPTTGTGRVLRGGSWYDIGRYCRSAIRNIGAPGGRNYGSGFRVVCVVASRTLVSP